MTTHDDDDDKSDADWLAEQFGDGDEPEQKPEPAAKPPADPPTLVNPFGTPGSMPPPSGPGSSFPPPTAASPPAAPPQSPLFPPVAPPPSPTVPPVSAQPTVPPSFGQPTTPPSFGQPTTPPSFGQPTTPPSFGQPTPPPSVEQPTTPPPAPAAQTPTEPPAQSPFPWGLQPGGDPNQAPPVVPPPVATPAALPVAPPPAAGPPAAPPVGPTPPWQSPVPGAAPAAAAAVPPPEPTQPFSWGTPTEPPPIDPAVDDGPQLAAEPPPAPMPWETARLPEVAPEAADAPAFWEPEPTQAIDQPTQAMDRAGWDEPAPTQLILPPAESFGAAAAATELLGAAPDPANEPTSALDALFGESRFREYEPGASDENPFVRKEEEPGRGKPGGIGTSQKVLLWVAAGLLGILALIALYLLGTRLPDLLGGPAPAVTQSASPSPSPSPTVLPVGPVEPGSYAWDELLGGECLDPWESPWAEEFTVVDCSVPHPAQLVHRAPFPLADPENEAYPGPEAFAAQLALLCAAPGVIDLAAAGVYVDAQVEYSYPATEEQWDEGQRDYFCFVTRSSGELLTGSVAVPKAPPPAATP